MIIKSSGLVIGLIVAQSSSCAPPAEVSTADTQQAAATQTLMSEAHAAVGMPGVTNFTQKRLLRRLYELLDQDGLVTYTYTIDMNGNRHFLCESIGYGMPFSAQYSNPQVEVFRRPHSGGFGALPQPEPNGIFLPDSTSATWVICVSEDIGAFTPLYVEPQIIVSPFKLPYNSIEG